MATLCKLCGKNIGFFDASFYVVGEMVCEDCYQLYLKVLNSVSDEDQFKENLLEFQNIFSDKECIEQIVKHLNGLHEEKLPQIEIKKKQEEEKRQQEEEKIRIKIETEKRIQEQLQQELNSKIDNLTQLGYDGYYEYKVVSLNDDDAGGIYPNTIENRLNQLGLEGWHLKCAYANELGKNSSSGGLGGFSVGSNSTIDQNILIFERFVKIKD